MKLPIPTKDGNDNEIISKENNNKEEKKIIGEKSYILKLDKTEYKLTMKINDSDEIIFNLTQNNIISIYYYEMTYNYNTIC